MSTNPLQSVIEQLQSQHAEAETRIATLKGQLDTEQQNLTRIAGALVALTAEKKKPLSKGASVSSQKVSRSISPKKIDVIQAMAVALTEGGVLEPAQLKGRVETLLTKQGFNRSGLAMRFQEACREKLFVETPAGFRLNDEVLSDGIFRLEDGSQIHITNFVRRVSGEPSAVQGTASTPAPSIKASSRTTTVGHSVSRSVSSSAPPQ